MSQRRPTPARAPKTNGASGRASGAVGRRLRVQRADTLARKLMLSSNPPGVWKFSTLEVCEVTTKVFRVPRTG